MAVELYPLPGELRALHGRLAVLSEHLAEMAHTHRQAVAQHVLLEADLKALEEALERGDVSAAKRHLATAKQRAVRTRLDRQHGEATGHAGVSIVTQLGRFLRRVGL